MRYNNYKNIKHKVSLFFYKLKKELELRIYWIDNFFKKGP